MLFLHCVILLFTVAGLFSEVKTRSDGELGDELRRDRRHINAILGLPTTSIENDGGRRAILNELKDIHETAISRIESLYMYSGFEEGSITDAEIYAKPILLVIGPWSTGKSTMINYLLGVENTTHSILTGAEPTTSEFTVIMHGNGYKTVEGIVMTTDSKSEFAALEVFGRAFLERLEGIQMPLELLQSVTIVDTPGIIENRRQQERGYPFNDVMKWFINRAALILVMFDPSKLDVGLELESTFRQLKGRESQVRFVLNKADSIEFQELLRVYGALFWSLSPLINVTEPPRVYVGSFHSAKLRGPAANHLLFHLEEVALLQHLHDVIFNSLQNKVALVRQHAIRVLIHAEMISAFLEAFQRERGYFTDNALIWFKIVDDPEGHGVYQDVLVKSSLLSIVISKHDLPSRERYRAFFRDFSLSLFQPLSKHCPYFSKCLRDQLVDAIKDALPQLLFKCQRLMNENDACDSDTSSCRRSVVEPDI